MPFPGPWIQPPDQAVAAILSRWLHHRYDVVSHSSDNDIWDGVGATPDPDYITDTSQSIELLPFRSFADPAVLAFRLSYFSDGVLIKSPFIDPPDPLAVGYEIDATDPGTLRWPIAVDFTANGILSGGADPGDETVMSKRLLAGDYTLDPAPYPVINLASWLAPATLAARVTVAEVPADSSSHTVTVSFADTDVDTNGVIAFWAGANYYTFGTSSTADLVGNASYTVRYTYRPPRFRYLYDARPPLAHRQRLDGTDTAGPQLTHVGTAGGRPPLAWRQNTP